MPRIIFLFGKDIGKEFPISGEVLLGRNTSCTVPVEDGSVSREHARIGLRGGKYFLSDLKSRNGSFINGKKIEQAELNFGDEIVLGKAALRFAADAEVKELEEIVLGGDEEEEVSAPVEPPAPAARPPAPKTPGKKELVFKDLPAPKLNSQPASLAKQDVSQYGGFYKFLIFLVIAAFCVAAFFATQYISGKITAASQKNVEETEEK